MKITVVVGNPKARSRTLGVAAAVADAVVDRLGIDRDDRLTIDLADHGPALFDWSDATVAGLIERLIGSDLLVIASPTYKATYTGLLKSFLDWVPAPALASVVAIPVMVGGAPIHHLAPEVHLRPLLVELGASCPTHGLFVLETQLERLDEVITEWLDRAGTPLAKALAPGT